MGFITPGVAHVSAKKRKGRHNRPFNTFIYPNENRKFASHYPKNLCFRHITNIKAHWEKKIMGFVRVKNFNFSLLSDIRYEVEKYIKSACRIESLLNITDMCPVTKEDATVLRNEVCKLEYSHLLYLKNTKKPVVLESSFDKHFNLIKGGCILLNKNKYKKKHHNKSISDFKAEAKLEIESAKTFTIPVKIEPVTIKDLPDDLLVKIFAESNNISNIMVSCKYFHNFILNHTPFISHQYILSRYTYKFKLNIESSNKMFEEVNDETHNLNAHTTKISQLKIEEEENENEMLNLSNLIKSDFKEKYNGDYVVTRYRNIDTLTVISTNAFMTPSMSYQIYKSLSVDHMITPSVLPDLIEKLEKEKNKLRNSEDELLSHEKGNCLRVRKNDLKSFWNEFPINVPYLDPKDPENIEYVKKNAYLDKLRIILDIMVMKTRFNVDIEIFLIFLISLINKVEENLIDEDVISLVPSSLIKKYLIFNLRQKLLSEDSEANANLEQLNDEEMWSKIKFKNPILFILLKNITNEELENLLCSPFIGKHLENDRMFWMTLKNRHETDLIEELIAIDHISPTPSILNLLVQ